jgi:hypothetical protein
MFDEIARIVKAPSYTIIRLQQLRHNPVDYAAAVECLTL